MMKNQENFFFTQLGTLKRKILLKEKKHIFKLHSIFFLEEKFFLCQSAAVLFS